MMKEYKFNTIDDVRAFFLLHGRKLLMDTDSVFKDLKCANKFYFYDLNFLFDLYSNVFTLVTTSIDQGDTLVLETYTIDKRYRFDAFTDNSLLIEDTKTKCIKEIPLHNMVEIMNYIINIVDIYTCLY